LVDLLEEHTLTLKHRLEAHELVAAEVDLVKEQHGTTLHRGHDSTIVPHHVAVDEAETTEQIILIGLRNDVDTEALASELRADLFDHRCLAVAGQTRDEHRREDVRLDDRGDVIEVTPRDILGVRGRDQSGAITTGHAQDLGVEHRRGGRGDLDTRRRSGNRSNRSSSRRRLGRRRRSVDDLGDMEQATTGVASGILDDPRGREVVAHQLCSLEELLARHGSGARNGGEGGEVRGLLGSIRHTVQATSFWSTAQARKWKYF